MFDIGIIILLTKHTSEDENLLRFVKNWWVMLINLTWIIWIASASSHVRLEQHNADKKSPDPFTHLQ